MPMMVKMMIKFSSNIEHNSDTIHPKDQPRLIMVNSIKLSSTESMTLLTDSNMVDMDLPPGTTHWPMLMMAKMTNQFSEQDEMEISRKNQ
jgi:hypothetical protein